MKTLLFLSPLFLLLATVATPLDVQPNGASALMDETSGDFDLDRDDFLFVDPTPLANNLTVEVYTGSVRVTIWYVGYPNHPVVLYANTREPLIVPSGNNIVTFAIDTGASGVPSTGSYVAD